MSSLTVSPTVQQLTVSPTVQSLTISTGGGGGAAPEYDLTMSESAGNRSYAFNDTVNSVSGGYEGTVVFGRNNIASAPDGGIIAANGALLDSSAQFTLALGNQTFAHSPGSIIQSDDDEMGAVAGKYQSFTAILKCTTTDANWTTFLSNGTQLTIRDNFAWVVHAIAIGKRYQATELHGFEVHGTANNLDGTVTLYGSWTAQSTGSNPANPWDFRVIASGSNVLFQVRGVVSATINWCLRVHVAEVYAEPPTPV